MSIEDLIPNEEVAVTISHAGYIKRTSLSEYKVQNRGGVGSKGSTTRDNDFLEELFVATNHNWLLIFTEKGKYFWMRKNIETRNVAQHYIRTYFLTQKSKLENIQYNFLEDTKHI